LRREVAEHDAEDRWRMAFDDSSIGIALATVSGRFLASNAVCRHMLGYSEAELLLSHSFLEVICRPERKSQREKVKAILEHGKRASFQIEKRHRKKNGDMIWLRSNVSLVAGSDKRPAFLFAVVEEVTERKQAEELTDKLLYDLGELNSKLERRIAERTAALQATAKQLESFSYTVAHDLKAPLRGIHGYSNLLLEEHAQSLDHEGKTFLSNIDTAARHMDKLIDGLLAYSRIERRELAYSVVDLRAFITSLLDERQGDLNRRGVDLSADVRFDTLVADTEGLALVLRNYLDNAMKFTRDVAHPRIEIGAEEIDGGNRFWVRDNGCGFDMQYSDRIFEMFQRLHRSEDHPGTGVGLAIVRKAAERWGGRAWAESEPGKGATFYIEMPRPPSH